MKIVYAIVASDKSSLEHLKKNNFKVSGSEIYFISYNKISAVLSELNFSGDAINTEFALKYARIIDALAQQVALLPMRFGTFIKSDEVVYQTLVNRYDLFLHNLRNVSHANEFGLKVLPGELNLSNQIDTAAVPLRNANMEGAPSGRSVYVTYLQKKMKGYKMENVILERAEILVEDISRYLKPWCRDQKFKTMATKNILIDAAFLVPILSTDDFIMAVQAWTKQHDDFHFLLSGPWPPYSFANNVTT